jgi:high affinity Mn2+ porin
MTADGCKIALGCLVGAVLWMGGPPRAVGQDSLFPRLPPPPPPPVQARLLTPVNAEEPANPKSVSDKDNAKAKDKDNGKSADNGNDKDKEKDDAKPAWYTAHVQATSVSQGNFRFHSPYDGVNSLLATPSMRSTMTGTLFLGMKLWQGAEVYFNPEIAGGFGISGAFGLAGFTNGEATRVGIPPPTPYIARLYVRQTIGLSGEMEKVEDGVNQIAGERDTHRLVISIGRVPASDSFDNNTFSHDPRTQFMNWTLIYAGAWDYPANVRGYDYGGSIELDMKTWALRYGIFGMPSVANGASIDPNFLRANGSVLEYERRYDVNDHPGKVRLFGYLNNAHMGDYRVALRDMPVNPDITLTRAYRIKYGFGINWEQEITKELGAFGRISWNDGHTETFAFTESDFSVCGGLLLKGKAWSRPQDQVGLGFTINDISNGHRAYLAAGGLGFELGDGALNYGTENVVEMFYNWEMKKGINVTLDFQEVMNPGYNRDRGPVSVLALRVHVEF